ncbi:MAG: EthD domain-containing protein [Gammaproteobacteria bacterium]|jgi:hypothetical protein|nr:EthD domain-containing protein [Gammaproteobacteria bacterium]|tara:strand:- start:1174 stop:1875 length:702 start_codon:yes stop_codon:yes gene_type:complete
MEKIVFKLWRSDSNSLEKFKKSLLVDLPKTLESLISELQINIADEDVNEAAALAQTNYSQNPDAIVFIKVASQYYSENIISILQSFATKVEGFIVSESIILQDDSKDHQGKRSEGFSQVVFLEKPLEMTEFNWFDHWTHHHTKIAIETQSNFTYIQNTVVRPLQKDSPNFIAVIEECFPSEAMSNPSIFYNAENDSELLLKNTELMMDSCSRFIDFQKIEVIPTSRYRMIVRK